MPDGTRDYITNHVLNVFRPRPGTRTQAGYPIMVDRKEEVRETLTVRQCYDVGDRITKKSIALESKINKALKPLLELTESVK